MMPSSMQSRLYPSPYGIAVILLLCFLSYLLLTGGADHSVLLSLEVYMSWIHNTKRWKRKSLQIRRVDRYMDMVALRFWNKRIEGTMVHHIYPADEYPEYAFCDWNLITVSRRTHEMLEDRQKGTLTALGMELQRRTVPGKNWRTK